MAEDLVIGTKRGNHLDEGDGGAMFHAWVPVVRRC